MSATGVNPAPIDLTTKPRRHRADVAARWVFRAGAWTTFVVTLLIILTLVVDAWEFLAKLADEEGGVGLGRDTQLLHAAARGR